jgi:hypothetical protein
LPARKYLVSQERIAEALALRGIPLKDRSEDPPIFRELCPEGGVVFHLSGSELTAI